MITVNQLMSGITSNLFVTQSLHDAAALLCDGNISGGEIAALVSDLSHRPVGLITEADLAEIAARHPGDWRKKRCACLLTEDLDFLRPEHDIEGVLERYRADDVKPLLVLEGDDPVGIVYPEAVFASCAEQRSPIWSGTTAAKGPSSDFDQLLLDQEAPGYSP
ncbi:CBS domain-containing protein [Nesterenkonia aurantiaca]|uniref:CBS domain-containing protein n=1 Tax=Nesterenkonia aurantiaca TaxID=1436010 RepID=A0A4R7G0N8_9MICC|nr:CBS domain-containing protein [Nesterenkonia aurantiaca]TDS84793.1 hypothetical protein EV640_107192 [Nesterenkonia aurantiaca]